MIVEKVKMLRIKLDDNDCCRNKVTVDAEYSKNDENLEQGNYFIEYNLSFEKCGIKTHLIGTWIESDKETIKEDVIDFFMKCVLCDINKYIRSFEEELEEQEERFCEKFCECGCSCD